jgi:prohibitin 2
MNTGLIKYALIAFAALILVLTLNPFVVIGAGERGVVMNFGAVQKEILNEGLHIRMPIMQKVVIMNVQVQKGEGQGDAASKDLQQVTTNVAINYHLDPLKVAHVYQTIGTFDQVGQRIICLRFLNRSKRPQHNIPPKNLFLNAKKSAKKSVSYY